MKTDFSRRRKLRRHPSKSKLQIFRNRATGYLRSIGSSLKEWALVEGISITQVSLALNGARRDKRSRYILSRLARLIES
jgi:hypothetical protein